jgi:hypothetical protein
VDDPWLAGPGCRGRRRSIPNRIPQDEAKAHALLADTKADKAAAKQTLDERFALMREVFQKTPLALNVAYVCWGEDALWARLGWERPTPARKP